MERNRIIRIILHRGQGDSSDEEEDELLHNQSYSSSESENNDEQNGVEDDSTDYDRSLPAQHLYLGELDEEGGTNIHEEETTPLLPLHYVSKHVLFPEEILPMQIFNPHSISMLRSAFTSHTPVAVCTDLRDDHHFMDVPQRPSLQDLSPMGTTADIVACREDDDGGWFHGPRFIVKFRGRQRFRLLEVHKKLNG
jgi:cereblon